LVNLLKGGGILSKFCGLGQAGFPLEALKRRRFQQFPFKSPTAMLPCAGPDYHLKPHCNPQFANQSRGFPLQPFCFLSSFANLVSNSNNKYLIGL